MIEHRCRRTPAVLATVALLSAAAAAGPTTAPATRPALRVTVDASASPDLADEGKRLAAAAVGEYPRLCRELDSPGFKPIDQVKLKFIRIPGGTPAYTTFASVDSTITLDVNWFHQHPDDIGCVVHELTHTIQHYTLRQPPGWVTEGIADWTRWFVYEPAGNNRQHPDPFTAKYDDAYSNTACFLDWAQKKYNPDLVQKLNAAARAGHYTPALWHELTGKTAPELGDEWEHAIFATVKVKPVQITVDTSAAPQCAAFAAAAKFAGERYYGRLAQLLASDGFTAPKQVTLTVKPGDGVAATGGDHIECNAAYYEKHPDDVGSIIHELTHVVQSYGDTGNPPGWLTEGIADYVRWFTWEPQSKRPHADAATAKYDASYQTSGEFLAWAQGKYDRQLVRKLNAALRKGTYRDDLWPKLCGGKTVQQVGDEWVASLRAGTGRRRRGG